MYHNRKQVFKYIYIFLQNKSILQKIYIYIKQTPTFKL